MSFLSKLGLRNWFKKTKQPSATRTHLNRPLSIESLETRITPTLSTVPGHDGGANSLILRIVQTDLPDTLTIELNDTTLTVQGNNNTITGFAPFGGTIANGIYTLDLASTGANGFAGILVEQLLSTDTLFVNGLDFGASNSKSTTITTNTNISIEFYGNRKTDLTNTEGINNLIFNVNNSGISEVSSKNDNIVYQQYNSIQNPSGKAQYSIANIPNSSLPVLNQYGAQTGNYFHIFDFNHSTTPGTARPITVSGSPIAFQATSRLGSASIDIDTEIVLQTDLLLGYDGIGIGKIAGNIDINSNAALSNSGFTNDSGPNTSFSSLSSLPVQPNLFITTSGSVSLNGINLSKGDLNIYDTGDFVASRDQNSTDVIVNNLVFNGNTLDNANAKFMKNVTVSQNFSIYNYGGAEGNDSNIEIGTNAFNNVLPPSASNYFLKIGGKFEVEPNNVATISTFSISPYPKTVGIYNLNVYSDSTTIGTNATLKNTGDFSVGAPGRNTTANAKFIVGGFIDGNKALRIDSGSQTTKIFADVTAGSFITFNSALSTEAATAGSLDREFTIYAANGNLTIGIDIAIQKEITLNSTSFGSKTGSNLILSAGNDDGTGNIPDGATFGNKNNVIIGGVNGLNRTLTIGQTAGFLAKGQVTVSNLILNKNKLNANSGAGFYTFEVNIGTDSLGVNFITNTGFYGISMQGDNNYFAGTSLFNNFGQVILGFRSSSVFNFETGAIFEANKDVSGQIYAPVVRGIGTVKNRSIGEITLNGATLAPGFTGNNYGVLKFLLPLNLKEKYPADSSNNVKGTYYVDFTGQVPGINQNQIITNQLYIDGEYILYPVFRNLDVPIGTTLKIVDQISSLGIFGRFSGLTDPINNIYSILNEGATFYASGASYTITYQGGNGNDVVITYNGIAVDGPETIVFVDDNNLLNVLGKDGSSNVTLENSIGSLDVLQLSISDVTFGLTGFAYGSKVIDNSITISVGSSLTIRDNDLLGIKVQQNAGNDILNLVNLSFLKYRVIDTTSVDIDDDKVLYTTETYNPNIKNLSFSFNGGPSAYPSNDIDVLNLVGTNRNISTGANNTSTVTINNTTVTVTSTVTVEGYDTILSDNSTIQAKDLYTKVLATEGNLFSSNQGSNALKVLGTVFMDKGNLSFGTINQSNFQDSNNNTDSNGGFVKQLVPLTPGVVIFTGDILLGDGVGVTFGNGISSTNFQFQGLYGTPGGIASNITFNTLANNQVYNGFNQNTTDIPQLLLVSNIFGGNISVAGVLGTDLGTIDFKNAGTSIFNGAVNAKNINITNSDGNIIFNRQVGKDNERTIILIIDIADGLGITFNDNLFASKISGSRNSYGVNFLGSITDVTSDTSLTTSGTIVLGDSNDSLSFRGGLTIAGDSKVFLYGSLTSKDFTINLTPIGAVTLTGDSSIKTYSGANAASSVIVLSEVKTNGFTLTLDSGNLQGSTITIKSLRGANGKLIVNSSGGVEINQVGNFPQPSVLNSSPEVFGSVAINDSIGNVKFSGPVLVNEIITTQKRYNILFSGAATSSSYRTFVNNNPVYRWFYFITGSSPTVFQNQGDVTFGIHGSNPQDDMDLFIFNGGVSTSTITGVTNLASRLYSVNKDINLGSTIMTESSFINSYFSSQVFNDLSGPTFLNPQASQSEFVDYDTGASTVNGVPMFNDNEIINTNILTSFGFKSNQLTSIGALNPPVQAFPQPYGDLPYPNQTGNISITTITNDAYYLHINAGGLGIYGNTVGGNVKIGTYTGGASADQLGFYRGNNFSITNPLVANNFYVGTIANTYSSLSNVANIDLSGSGISSPSLPAEIDLTGSVTIQSNFTIKNNFLVTPDVNNLLIMGSNNQWVANNTISNSGVLQLGNSASSVFNVSNNLNVQGPSIRRIGGNFIASATKVLDFGPGPITLIGDTVLTTDGIGKTTLGQVTNNQFNLIVNGTAELQKYADDFSLAPYPSLTTPSSYIPTNNFVGAGVGGAQNNGNVTFNGIVKVQQNNLFNLNAPVISNNTSTLGGFSSATGNGIAAIGFTRLPEVVVSGGGGSGAVVIADLGFSINGFTGTVIGNKVTFKSGSVPAGAFANASALPVTIQQPVIQYLQNPNVQQPTAPNLVFLSNNRVRGTIDVAGGFITSFTINSGGLNGGGYTDLTNLYFNSGATYVSVGNPVVGGLVGLVLQNPGAGYTSPPTVSVLNTTSGTVANGNSTGLGFYGTNGAAPLSAINNGVTPNVIINTSISPATIPTDNVIKIPTTTTLRKQGTGSVFLNSDSSANTAGLATTIENGNFFFENGKINAATVTNVTGNGLLGGTNGTLGAVNILPRGQLSPGNLTNPIGVLNLQGNLSVQSTYKVNIRSVAFNFFDQVNVTGAVSLAKNNINGILDVAFTSDADVLAGNTFGIISNDGTDTVTGKFKTPAGVVLNQGDSFTVNMPNGTDIATFQISYTGNIAANGSASLTGGNDVVIQITGIQSISSAVAAKSKNLNKFFAVSTDSGGGPIVKISFADGSGFSFFAYDTSFTGGVRTAIGDVNGDGNPDLITAAGPGGGPHVIIWTITAGVPYATVQSGFFAFEPGFTGGITLATGNINGDVSSSGNSLDDIIVGAGAGGGPRVKAFAGNANFASINNQSQLVDFFAYAPEFNLGVNVAAGDRTGDGNDEIITGAAQGGGPHVQVWQISNGTANSIQSFFAFDPSYLCGVFVGSGDLDGDGLADIYTGTGSGPIGSVGIYFGNGAVSRLEPFGSGFTGGVRVGAALGALNSNTSTYPPYLLTAAGPGGGPQVSLFDSNLNIVDAFFAFQENFTGGVLASTTVNT